MTRKKVRMMADSWNIKAGDEFEMEREQADQLVADGHAVPVSTSDSGGGKKKS